MVGCRRKTPTRWRGTNDGQPAQNDIFANQICNADLQVGWFYARRSAGLDGQVHHARVQVFRTSQSAEMPHRLMIRGFRLVPMVQFGSQFYQCLPVGLFTDFSPQGQVFSTTIKSAFTPLNDIAETADGSRRAPLPLFCFTKIGGRIKMAHLLW